LAQDQVEEAKETFREGIKARSKYAYNHIGLARAYHDLGMTEDRNNSIEQAIKVNKKEDVDVMLALANAYTDTEQLKEAKLVLYKARETDPDQAQVYVALGDMYYAQKVYDVAEENYEKALELNSGLIEAYFRLGRINIIKKSYNDGLSLLNQAIALDPNLAPAYRERAELYLKAGGAAEGAKRNDYFQKGRDDYEKYTSLLPDDIRAQLRYASFLYLTGDYQACLDRLDGLDTTTVVSQRLRGYCALETGNLEKAEKEMEKYFEIAPADRILPEDYETMAKLFLDQGDDEKATQYLDKMFVKAKEVGNDKLSNPEARYEKLSKQFKKEKDYFRETYYTEKLMESRVSGVSSKDYYNLGMASRRAGASTAKEDPEGAMVYYDKAKTAFGELVSLAPTYAPGQFWLGYCKTQIATLDSTSEEAQEIWPGKGEYMAVWESLKETPVDELSAGDKYYLGNSALYLVMTAFNPNKDDSYDCDAAQPFVDKAIELDPKITERTEGSALKQIIEYCTELKKSQEEGGR
jgi:tetratricopeptide (TPR) repeat protein